MTYSEEEIAWILLCSLNGMTPKRFYRVLAQAGDCVRIINEPEAYRKALGDKLTERLKGLLAKDETTELFARMEKLNVSAMTRVGKEYPESLQHIPDPPPVLFIKGSLTLESEKQLAIVGTRRATYDGKKSASVFAGILTESGVSIVSGLARGIDTLAHTACLEAGGHTIAVLGNGLASVYPPENESLAQQIVDHGGSVISELPLDETPSRWTFPARNRLIAGLSRGVLIVEGDRKSGSLITANAALEQGREVFAIPGSIYNSQAEGTNYLIQNGAFPALSPMDIIEYMHWSGATKIETKEITPPELDETEKIIYDLLKNETLSFEELAEATGFDAEELNSCLTMLTLRSIIIRLPGNQYRLA